VRVHQSLKHRTQLQQFITVCGKLRSVFGHLLFYLFLGSYTTTQSWQPFAPALMALSTSGKAVKRTRKPRAIPSKSLPDLDTLERMRRQGLKAHRRAPRTQAAYAGYVKQGSVFLCSLVVSRKAVGNADGRLTSDMDLGLLEAALGNPPNKYSAMVLEFFLVERCLKDGLGKSTADGIHAAFNDFWNQM
jgi:hypothetical protein